MDLVLEISQYVLTIGGALSIILMFIVLFYILTFFIKVKRLVTHVQQSYQQFLFMVLTPFNKVREWLREEDNNEVGGKKMKSDEEN